MHLRLDRPALHRLLRDPHDCADGRDRGWPRNLLAVVEILPDEEGLLSADLLRAAYGASRDGVIALALTGVTVPAVNAVMDRIVPDFPLDIPGIRYLTTPNRPLLSSVLARAPFAFGESDAFRTAAAEIGFRSPPRSSRSFEFDDVAAERRRIHGLAARAGVEPAFAGAGRRSDTGMGASTA